ncbi:pyridine nucleotide-disulfide oxidoreductase-domain-containing protein [Polychytrium aggregatum]|uniref:pyridine nucleotide-disulfide oxidoreductase-domain-containing protein n=1 Tax=Polychytrium aggregatum TaxID=110093 RepID=UPI0022FE7714|nr:pyridine nucleotide-disulfide oxidoreductase-domain-containing protein [Polychytrium aggregatum]KAI9209016.1 pyridine nucleotide-disulfide oxidoreductase-domain-containing protein [Polychytrium aggregatum]
MMLRARSALSASSLRPALRQTPVAWLVYTPACRSFHASRARVATLASPRMWAAGAVALGAAALLSLNSVASDSPSQSPALLGTESTGPDGIPIATNWIQDPQKPLLVVLGSGWGATSLLKELEPGAYNTLVISPTNYFLFTPLLPEATTGTVETRSLMESIRRICQRVRATYFEAHAYDVDVQRKLVLVEVDDSIADQAVKRRFYVPYDRLVVAVGAQNNTFGIPGVSENCNFLKSIKDARAIRAKMMDLFEHAALPTTTEAERKKFLSFVVAGGGPTGVEYAAELSDFLHEDLIKFFPDLVRNDVSITVIQSADHILNTYSKAISEFAEQKFKRQSINVVTNARVTRVNSDTIEYKLKKPQAGGPESIELPYGMCVWSTGIGMKPITKRLTSSISEQKNSKALLVDTRLRLLGGAGVYALGDCATIETPQMLKLVNEHYQKTGRDLWSYGEFKEVADELVERYPQTAVHLGQCTPEDFEKLDLDHNGRLDRDEIKKWLDDVNNHLTSLAPTAQVASQQGAYLAHQLNQLSLIPRETWDHYENTKLKPFRYRHFGSFSYVGHDNAVLDLQNVWSSVGHINGVGAYFLWRGAYLSEQVSLRTRALIGFDWVKKQLFGRDITRS